MKDTIMKLIKEKRGVVERINESLKKELLKEENLTGSPRRLKEIVNLFGADYKVFSEKINNPFGSEQELRFEITEEYLYKGYMPQVRCSIFRKVDLGLVKPISTAEISDVRVLATIV